MVRTPTLDPATRAEGASLVAVPRSGKVGVRLEPGGRLITIFRNRIAFPKGTRPWLERHAPPLWCPATGPVQKRRFAWAVNQLADPDDYGHALAWQDATIARDIPIFNHPRAVALTRRDLSADRLAGVPGLVVPRCTRFQADSLAACDRAFSDHGFRFPVLVRPCSTQGGIGQLRIDGPAGWDAVLASRWFGQPHYLTQFEDSQSADGTFFKARVVFVGDRAFVRHVKASSVWQVHNRAPGRLADDREMEIVAALEVSAIFRGICADVASRTRLDLCGMDVGVDTARDRFVLFECNPAMTIFFPDRPDATAALVARRARLQAPIERALDALVREPQAWAVTRRGIRDLPSVRSALGD